MDKILKIEAIKLMKSSNYVSPYEYIECIDRDQTIPQLKYVETEK